MGETVRSEDAGLKESALDAATPSPTSSESPFAKLEGKDGTYYYMQKGKPFVSLGVSVVQPKDPGAVNSPTAYDALTKLSGDGQAWAAETKKRLQDWGFNSVGAWSSDEIYRTGLSHTRVAWLGGYNRKPDLRLIDVFSPEYDRRIEADAKVEVAPYADDPNLIGFFTNNELPFYGEHGWPTDPDQSLFDRYIALDANAPGRKAAVAFFRNSYPTLKDAQKDWDINSFDDLETAKKLSTRSLGGQRFKYQWAGEVADKYFSLARDAIRRHAPNHLILGSRFAGKPPASVARAQGKYCDVASINHYSPSGHPDVAMLRNLHALTGKPIMITEFSWRAMQNRSGNKNSTGAEVTVETQQERAKRYETYVSELFKEPYIVGAHWFQYFDQPTEGRNMDGENSNYGIVDIHDEPYLELVDAMRSANERVVSGVGSRIGGDQSEFDEIGWGELLPVRLDGGPLASPFAIDLVNANTFVKADKGNSGSFARSESGGLDLNYESTQGWGLHGDIPLPAELAGANAIQIRFNAPKGSRFRLFLTESGDGPPGQQVYSGRAGGDGESFEFPVFQATGEEQTVEFSLKDGALRAYWGNQRGDRTLATAGLDKMSILVMPGTGNGKIQISQITFLNQPQSKTDP